MKIVAKATKGNLYNGTLKWAYWKWFILSKLVYF